MCQREQEKCAQDRRTAMTLRGIATDIHASRCLVQAAEMGAGTLAQHQRDPLVELLAMIAERLERHAVAIETHAHQEDAAA